MDHAIETMTIRAGDTYELIVQDQANDGIAGIGNVYEVTLTDHPDVILAAGDGVYTEQRLEEFYVPLPGEFPTGAPTRSPAPTVDSVVVVLTIFFDEWHQETAWQIVAQQNPNQVLAEAIYDTYRKGESITEEIYLPKGRPYIFLIKDFFNDGIDGGKYEMKDSRGNVLFRGDGNFGAERSHQFAV
jgi:hypothetical protein